MKILVALTALLIFIAPALPAQNNSGKGFNYQGVARGQDGAPRAGENIELRFSLLPEIGLSESWQETHVATTSDFGVFAVIVGKGIKTGGTAATYADVDFSTNDYWLRVELKSGGSWMELSQFQLPSMPYAEVAHKAGNTLPVPVGSIIPFAGPPAKIPDGYKLCNGEKLSREAYPELYAAIGTAWGHGDGSTTFALPDLRGLFLRGVAGTAGRDPDKNNRRAMNEGGNTNNNVGSRQLDEFQAHDHTGTTNTAGNHDHGIKYRSSSGGSVPGKSYVDISGGTTNLRYGSDLMDESGNHRHTFRTEDTGGSETRPDNAYVNYLIKI